MKIGEDYKSESGTEPRRSAQGPPSSSFLKGGIALIVAAAIIGAVVYWGLVIRARSSAALERETEQMAVPTVSVIGARRGAPNEEIALPGNIQAFTDSPIYARTNGYLKRWYADIGTHVKAGQLLAEIETPEIDQQLRQAHADLATAVANYNLAKSTAARWQFLLKSDSVSKQETDEKVGDLQAKKAIVDSAGFNVRRLEETQAFQKVYAPFDGVITARNTDVGNLISAGSAGAAKELFHMAAVSTLRVYVNVPQTYSRVAVPGVAADLTLAEYPGRRFRGRLVRTAHSIDPVSRTLLVEIDVDNRAGVLLPGAFTEVHLKLPSNRATLLLPVNTLLFRSEGLRVAVVRGGRAELVPIAMGRDFGKQIEVLSGLNDGDQVIVNPSDSLVSGMRVRVAKEGAGGGTQ